MPSESRPTLQPIHIALLVIAAGVLLFIWFWPTKHTEPKQAITLPDPIITEAPSEPAPAIKAEPKAPEQQPEAKTKQVQAEQPALPNLDESDAAVFADLKQPQYIAIENLLTNEYFIRKVVRSVVAASNGEWVNQHRPLQPPKTGFAASNQNAKLQIAEANFARYTPYIDALEKIGSQNLAVLYEKYSPLLQEAYEELGLKDKSFKEATLKAISIIETAPPYNGAELTHTSVMYKFKNQEFENLPEAQKAVIRMGEHNQKRLKKLLSELKTTLK